MTEHLLTGVGLELSRARKAAGLAVADVARDLRLVPRQIESLEQERFERLPGPTIARRMVRDYARLLKLDPEPLVDRMAPGAEKAPSVAEIAARHRDEVPASAGSHGSTMLYVGFSVAIIALVVAMAYHWQRDRGNGEATTPTGNAAPAQAAPALSQPQPSAGEKIETPVEKSPGVEAQAEAQAEAPLVKPEAEVAAQSAVMPGVHRLVLRMDEEAWLEVRDGAGRSLISSLSPASSERAVRGQPPFDLVIGNAAHVKLTYDGKPVDLEPHIKGEVARLTLK